MFLSDPFKGVEKVCILGGDALGLSLLAHDIIPTLSDQFWGQRPTVTEGMEHIFHTSKGPHPNTSYKVNLPMYFRPLCRGYNPLTTIGRAPTLNTAPYIIEHHNHATSRCPHFVSVSGRSFFGAKKNSFAVASQLSFIIGI